ncbi:MAG: hypothetical protein HC873_22315, partial [Leptolyngbyaceae cyanobacterium SL_1_1]|nr:hypothetical protein [Leptolyngbyaceae cyanobacterium SL_1_1]
MVGNNFAATVVSNQPGQTAIALPPTSLETTLVPEEVSTPLFTPVIPELSVPATAVQVSQLEPERDRFPSAHFSSSMPLPLAET